MPRSPAHSRSANRRHDLQLTAARLLPDAAQVAIGQCVELPRIIVYCKSILDTVAAGPAVATAASRPNARIWRIIAHHLDDRLGQLLSTNVLDWMPAHQSTTAIDHRSLASGRLIKPTDWRANRLVDALARKAAAPSVQATATAKLLRSALRLVEHEAALLGVVTHAANHHEVCVTGDDGSQ